MGHTHDENCGCGCDHDHEDFGKMSLVLEDNREVICDVLGIFSLSEDDPQEYIALLPENEEDVLIYRYKEDEDGITLDNIETDDEYDEVAQCFDDLFLEELEEDLEEIENLEDAVELDKLTE